MLNTKIKIEYIEISKLNSAEYNPRSASKKEKENLKEGIKTFGLVDPLIVNNAENRKNIIIGGHLRLRCAKELNLKEVPGIYLNIPDIEKEKELNLRLNKNLGRFDNELLAKYDRSLLKKVGFARANLRQIFKKKEEFEGEEGFTTEVLEANNYVLFAFDNILDWNFIKEKLQIKPTNALDSKKGYKRRGIGRVLKGKVLIDLLK